MSVPGSKLFYSVDVPDVRSPAASRFSDIGEIAAFLRRRRDPLTVTVIAPMQTLTFDALEKIASAAVVHGHAVGVMPCDQARESGAHSTSARAGRWLLYDALRRQGFGSHGGELDNLFAEPWDLIGFLGHGDGSHLNLGSGVLCGLFGQVETTAGQDSPDGCQWEPPACKKQASVPVVYQIGRLRAHTIALLSCNGISLAGQIYPSNVSLAIAAYHAGATAVLGLTRQVRFTQTSFAELLDLMCTMNSIGSVVTAFNSARRIGEDGAIALLGDAGTPPPREAARQARQALAAAPPSGLSLRPSHAYPTVPAAAISDDPARAGRVGLLSGLAAHLTGLEHVTRGLRWLSRVRVGADDPVARELVRAETARRQAAERVQRERFEIFSCGLDTVGRRQQTDQSVRVLTDAMMSLLHTRILDESHPGGGVGDLVAPALAMFLDRDDPEQLEERCARCAGALTLSTLRDPVARIPDRTRTTCAACGTLSDTGLVRFRMTCRGAAHRGGRLIFGVDMTPARPQWPLRGVFQVRDKSRSAAFGMRQVQVGHGTEIPFQVPEDAGLDLWSARLVAVGGGSIEYARRVFTVGPDGDCG